MTISKIYNLNGTAGPAVWSCSHTSGPDMTDGADGDFCLYSDNNNTMFLKSKKAGAWINVGLDDIFNIGALDKSENSTIISDGTSWKSQKMEISKMADIDVTTLSIGQVLKFNGTNWKGSGLSDINIIKQVKKGNFVKTAGNKHISISETPTSSTGTMVWADSIVVAAGSSKVEINCNFIYDKSGASSGYVSFMLFRGTTVLGIFSGSIASSDSVNTMSIALVDDLPNLLGGTYTYSIRAASDSGTWYVGQNKYGDNYNNNVQSVYSLKEIL